MSIPTQDCRTSMRMVFGRMRSKTSCVGRVKTVLGKEDLAWSSARQGRAAAFVSFVFLTRNQRAYS